MDSNRTHPLIGCGENVIYFLVELVDSMYFLQVELLDRVIGCFTMVTAEILLEVEQVLAMVEEAGGLLILPYLVFIKLLVQWA